MHPRDYEYIVNNFIALYNQNNKPYMKLVREGNSKKNIYNSLIVDYKVNFFVNFPNRKSYHAYEISVNIQRDVRKSKSFKFENSIISAEFKGVMGLSDVQYGVPNDITNRNNIRFYKDTNKYGEYLFMYNDKDIKNILNKKSGQVDVIEETDKTGVKKIPVGTRRNIYQDRFQRNQKLKDPKYVPENIYTQPSKTKGKLMIGNKCMDVNGAGKVVSKNCDFVKTEFEYVNDRLRYVDKDGNKCLSYHADGNLELLTCDNIHTCKPNEMLNNCMDYKFIKYGGLEIKDNNSCLNPRQNTFIGEPCLTSSNADLK